MQVDCNFPGGNIIVEGIEGEQVFVHQDLRDTRGWWFYWYFRVRGAAGCTLTFHFTKGNCIGVRGPAVSSDGGRSWRWLGKESIKGASFRYSFAIDENEVRFCFAIPYLQANLEEFLHRFQGHPKLKKEVLCQTEKGRDIEMLRLGRLDGNDEHKVLLTCRHHACESMANYALEGIMEAALAETDDAKWFQEHVEFLVIPFLDKDGVEEGDQGKNRKPHDHWQDYGEKSIYRSVRALRELITHWSEGRLHFALDMHCPFIRGGQDECIHFVGGPNQENWKRVGEFSKILENVLAGPLPFRAMNNLPFGKGWNTEETYSLGKSFALWAEELSGIWFVSTVEVPYANAEGEAVTAESARAFGHDVARALRIFLEQMKR